MSKEQKISQIIYVEVTNDQFWQITDYCEDEANDINLTYTLIDIDKENFQLYLWEPLDCDDKSNGVLIKATEKPSKYKTEIDDQIHDLEHVHEITANLQMCDYNIVCNITKCTPCSDYQFAFWHRLDENYGRIAKVYNPIIYE